MPGPSSIIFRWEGGTISHLANLSIEEPVGPSALPRNIYAHLSFKSSGGAYAVFALALTVALLHHFCFNHPRTTFLYDARSYLDSTTHVAQFLSSVLHGKPDTSFISSKAFLGAIVNDGPVLTGTFGAIFALSGHIPQNKDWSIFEIIQSVMHALSAVCVYLAARRATKVQTAALFSGLLWATYPAAIVASGRFYNEPLMILLMLASLVCSTQESKTPPGFFVSRAFGAWFAGLAFLMKPALVAGAGFTYLCNFLSGFFIDRKKLLTIAAITVGIICAFGPWALYTKTFMGKAYFTTPRNGSYNLAMGNDTDVDGVLTSPMPPLTEIFVYDKEPVYFMYSQWSSNMGGYLTMVARKATRMYGHPWNDFRHKYFGLTAHQQQYWHWALLFAGMSGLLVWAVETLKNNRLDFGRNNVFYLSAGWLFAPTIYLLFEANSRYGFTITPFLAVFASLPLARFIEGERESKISQKPAHLSGLIATVTVAALLTTVLINLDNLSHWQQSKETVHEMAPHAVALKDFILKPDKQVKDARYLIMVDGDARLENAVVTVNRHQLKEPLKHLRYFYPAKYQEYYVFQELGYSMAQLPSDYRQYYAAEIPADWLSWAGDNTVEVRAGDSGLTIYGESKAEARSYLSPLYFSPIKIGNASVGLETRLKMPELKARVEQSSAIISGANQKQILPGSLRIHIVAADRLVNKSYDQPESQAQWVKPKVFDIKAADFDRCFYTGKTDELHTSRHVVDAAKSVCAEYTIPRSPGSNAIKLSLSGQVKALKRGSKIGLLIASKNAAGQPVLISKTPPYLSADTNWSSFKIDDILPTDDLAPGPISLTIAIYPGPWEEICGYSCDKTSADAILKGLTLKMEPTYQLNLSKYRLLLF